MSDTSPIRLRIPQPNLKRFTAFELEPETAQAWADALPLANTPHAAQSLRRAISDLNQFELPPELRFSLLEILRPNLMVVLSNLASRFLHRPLVLHEDARQLAELADDLHGLAATGYAIVAVQTIQDSEAVTKLNPARLACEAIHRGLGFCGRNILQSLQLYQPVEVNLWLTLNQLYALAERQQLTEIPVTDPLTGSASITCAYLQALLLGCCKPNQLRQSDLEGIYRGLQGWSEHVTLSGPDGTGIFLVDLASDAPPMYADMYRGKPRPDHRHIDTGGLIRHLEGLRGMCIREGRPGVQFDEHAGVPCNIIDHLVLSFGSMSLRHFSRIPSNAPIWISVGLTNTHYHSAGGRTFAELLFGEYESPAARAHHFPSAFLGGNGRSANDGADEPETGYIVIEEFSRPEAARAAESTDPEMRYPAHRVRMTDASPAGYGLEWPSEEIPDLATGNIVCLRENEDDEWAIAAVRWVSKPGDGRTCVGVELLSPGAKPYGALIHHKTETRGEPLRVLLLPEVALAGQPHTLITPRAGFREHQKVTLLREGEEFLIQLLRQVALTGSFAQFDFRYIKQLEEVLAETPGSAVDSVYDSVWNHI